MSRLVERLHRGSVKDVISVEVEVFAHSTEDPGKVLEAMQFFLPEEVKVRKEKVRGHHGNEVLIYRVRLLRNEAGKVLRHIAAKMREEDRRRLAKQFYLRVDGRGNLYLRFDKQKAFLKKAILSSDEDVVKVKVKFPTNKPEEIYEICRDVGLVQE